MVPHLRVCLRRVCGHGRIWLACFDYRQTASNLGSSNFHKLELIEALRTKCSTAHVLWKRLLLINSADFPTSIPVHSSRRHSFKPASPSVTPFRSHRTSFPSRPEELKRSVLVYPAGPRACKDLKWKEKTCRLDRPDDCISDIPNQAAARIRIPPALQNVPILYLGPRIFVSCQPVAANNLSVDLPLSKGDVRFRT